MRQVIEPLGESLDDFEIFRRLAEVLGVETGFTEGLEPMDIFEASYDKTTAGKEVPFDKFWEDGVVRVDTPIEERTWTRHGAFREDPDANPLHTQVGQGRDLLPGDCRHEHSGLPADADMAGACGIPQQCAVGRHAAHRQPAPLQPDSQRSSPRPICAMN